jgi:hypothetical protein
VVVLLAQALEIREQILYLARLHPMAAVVVETKMGLKGVVMVGLVAAVQHLPLEEQGTRHQQVHHKETMVVHHHHLLEAVVEVLMQWEQMVHQALPARVGQEPRRQLAVHR